MTHKINPADFAEYLSSVVKLEKLQNITDNLDQELVDSQNVMMKIKAMFNCIPNSYAGGENMPSGSVNSGNLPNESGLPDEISRFLEADTPNLLLPDMTNEHNVELDEISGILMDTKRIAEKLKNEHEELASQISGNHIKCVFTDLNLNQYAATLTDLSNRLANIKIQKREQFHPRNAELEEKLSQLNQDVHFFTKMIKAKEAFKQTNEDWKTAEQCQNSSHYQIIINKLLSDINEVTYLTR